MGEPPEGNSRVLTVKQAVADLQVPESRVLDWISRGLFPAYQTRSIGPDSKTPGVRDYRAPIEAWAALKDSLLVPHLPARVGDESLRRVHRRPSRNAPAFEEDVRRVMGDGTPKRRGRPPKKR